MMSNVLLQLLRNAKGKGKIGSVNAVAMLPLSFKGSFMCIITSFDYIMVS